jgi:DNA-binding transcriptional regulator YiaG
MIRRCHGGTERNRQPAGAKVSKAHSVIWRAPGRWAEERKRFAVLMRRVEARRLKLGLSKTALAAKLETTTDVLRAWMTGERSGGRRPFRSSKLSSPRSFVPSSIAGRLNTALARPPNAPQVGDYANT